MPELIGQTLSHYRITAALGAGGMGEVYRATDSNLGRDVAIKVLPPEVAHDAERLARFRREAHLLAALNHPNIAAIYGLEEADGKPFLALELVEGEDLKQRLARGAIPVDEALEIAEQIALALEEAHAKGIVHRDLKPANVKLTPGGKVKVLDFGLAKAWAGDAADGSSSSSALSQSPTLAHTGTAAGLILGTAAYMSPEQARGRPVDKRADVWAFGVLLWEMLSGRALFAGDTVTDVIAAVVTREPDLDALPAATPPAVRRLIARCLRKDPRTRLPDIGAARLELQDVRSGATAEGPAAALEAGIGAERRGRTRERLWAALAVALAGLAAVLLSQRSHTASEAPPAAHFVLDTPEGVTLGDGTPVLSPDGRKLVFDGQSASGVWQIWIRALDSTEARPLPGTDAGGALTWSPDGTTLAFVTGGEIRKLVLAGGTVLRICALPRPLIAGGTWSEAGDLVFAAAGSSDFAFTLYRVPAAGGEATPLTTLDQSRGETAHTSPQFLPDGRRLLFRVTSSQAPNAGLFATSLEAPGERRRILPETRHFEYATPGHLLSVQDGVLTARRFDPRQLDTKGEAVSVASNVATWTQVPDFSWFSASATGHLAWLSGRSGTRQLRLEWLDRAGKVLGTLGEPATYGQMALSPDGRRVAAEIQDPKTGVDLWLIDVARDVASRLTTDAANEREPVWSPDGRELLFTSDSGGDENILHKALQGSEPAAPLPGGVGATPGERDLPENWSRAGNTLLYMTLGKDRTFWAFPMDGKGKPERLLSGQFSIDEPHVSPDGRWLAYISTESGQFELYVEPFRRRGEKLRVSTSGGGQPRWRGDGRELFYLSPDGGIVSVSVREGASGLELGRPTTLVSADRTQAVVTGPDYDDWDVTPDGQRFLVKVSATPVERPRIHVLLNWPSLVPR